MRPAPRGNFPYILHQLLSYAKKEGLDDIVSWCPDGRAFVIYDRDRFLPLIKIFFRQSMFKSFMRQLQGYGFQMQQEKDLEQRKKDLIRHPLFRRGQPFLCSHLLRTCKKDSVLTIEELEEIERMVKAGKFLAGKSSSPRSPKKISKSPYSLPPKKVSEVELVAVIPSGKDSVVARPSAAIQTSALHKNSKAHPNKQQPPSNTRKVMRKDMRKVPTVAQTMPRTIMPRRVSEDSGSEIPTLPRQRTNLNKHSPCTLRPPAREFRQLLEQIDDELRVEKRHNLNKHSPCTHRPPARESHHLLERIDDELQSEKSHPIQEDESSAALQVVREILGTVRRELHRIAQQKTVLAESIDLEPNRVFHDNGIEINHVVYSKTDIEPNKVIHDQEKNSPNKQGYRKQVTRVESIPKKDSRALPLLARTVSEGSDLPHPSLCLRARFPCSENTKNSWKSDITSLLHGDDFEINKFLISNGVEPISTPLQEQTAPANATRTRKRPRGVDSDSVAIVTAQERHKRISRTPFNIPQQGTRVNRLAKSPASLPQGLHGSERIQPTPQPFPNDQDMNIPQLRWDEWYLRLLKYKLKHGTAQVPLGSLDREEYLLAHWMKQQRSKCMIKWRIDLLNEIGFNWDTPGPSENRHHGWMRMYQRLVAYKTKHGTTQVPLKSPSDPGLGKWVDMQCRRHLLKYQCELLIDIGFTRKDVVKKRTCNRRGIRTVPENSCLSSRSIQSRS